MTIVSRVCAEFHDRTGEVLFRIRPADLLKIMYGVPDSIRQDPLFDMLVADRAMDVVESRDDLKKLENDPDKSLAEAEDGKTEKNAGRPKKAAQPEPAAGETAAASADAGKNGKAEKA